MQCEGNRFCTGRKGGTEEGEWVEVQCEKHMAAVERPLSALGDRRVQIMPGLK